MSFIQLKNKNPQETSTPAIAQSTVSMRIDVVPIPTESSLPITSKQQQQQIEAIENVKAAGKDLFTNNSTVVSENGGNRLYQTADLYSESLSLEKMIPMLTAANLTLRLNALREGHNAHSTCMELKTGQLADLVENTNADVKGEKSTSINIATAKEHGNMYVGVKMVRGNHYIQKLDYEVNTIHDTKMHVK